MKNVFLILAVLLQAAIVSAQQHPYAQLKEKVYVQTSHVFFKPGESMWFKVYVVNANDQRPPAASSLVIVDVISPSGVLLKQMKLPLDLGHAQGVFDFNADMPGGIYKLKAYTSWMKNEKESTFFEKEITLQKLVAPRILMKLEFPVKGYGPGDEVTADYTMRSVDDAPIKFHEVKYTLSVGGKQLSEGHFQTDAAGKHQLRFRLPAVLDTADGLLNITARYGGYTESISRSIPLLSSAMDFQLLPEGGTLVAGLSNNIAFRAVDSKGKPVDVKGYLADEHGMVQTFESYKFGMGQFPLVPQVGHVYKAIITSPKNIQTAFNLPPVQANGVVLNVVRDHGLNIKIGATQEQDVQLTGITHNTRYYTQTLHVKKGEQVITVDEKLFPAGIARFTLYNTAQRPLAERVVFLSPQKVVHTTITTDKKVYTPRGLVKLKVKTTDENGRPIPSDFSLAVMDDKLWTIADDRQDHILSWLLMSSELHGKVEEPTFYFKKEEENAAGALDLVMLTHGYRYFDYLPEVQQQGLLKYLPDPGAMLEGEVVDEKGRGVKGEVYLITMDQQQPAASTVTNDTGYFRFYGITPGNRHLIIAKALQEGRVVNVRTRIQRDFRDSVYAGAFMPGAITYGKPVVADKEPDMLYEKKNTPIYDPFDGREQHLSEVIVLGYGQTSKRMSVGSVVVVRTSDILSSAPAQQLQGKVAGLVITENSNPGSGANVKVRGVSTIAGAPLMVIDNMVVDKLDDRFTAGDILSVVVLKGAEAVSIYGSRGADGAVIVTTKTAQPRLLNIPLNKKHFYKTQVVTDNVTDAEARRVFYAPFYASTDTWERKDFRETIYWNGTVQTNKNGEGEVSFYNSDASTTFRAIAEGIGFDGRPGRAEATYVTQLPVTLDLKVPPYLTVGDSARLPLLITNTSGQPKRLRLLVTTPGGLMPGSIPDSVIIPANRHQLVYLPVMPVKPLKGELHLRVTGSGVTESMASPIEAGAKGFPAVINLSGNETAKQQFSINDPLRHSLTSRFEVYADGMSEVTSGINDMLREPHGCFEQTASSAYPNIYVIKLLKASGGLRADLEEKAKLYMEIGYRKMAGYEIKGGGFDLFGRGPANLSLSAYGLLVFSEMKSHIQVDEQMMLRTRDYLLRNMDSRGANWDNMHRLYTIYALSQVGYGASVQNEYKAVAARAYQSKDPYQLALAALAADNLRQPAYYQQMMAALYASDLAKLPPAAVGFMGSRGVSLEIEVRSLYVLALLRNGQPDMVRVNEQLRAIRSKRSYNGYQSTQATALALNAITTTQLAQQQTLGATAGFRLNGQDMKGVADLTALLQPGDNFLDVTYGGQRNPAVYNLEIGYTTQLPRNSSKAEIAIRTSLQQPVVHVGETVRLNLTISNDKPHGQATVLAKICIPAGLSLQPWQLKEMQEKGLFDYYEIFDNYLVFYWKTMAAGQTQQLSLDLKADIPGSYKGKANTAFLYYMPEHRNWTEGLEIKVEE